MQQVWHGAFVMHAGGGDLDGVHQSAVNIGAGMYLYAEVPSVAFLGLRHVRIALTRFVLGGWGCCNQCGIYHGAST